MPLLKKTSGSDIEVGAPASLIALGIKRTVAAGAIVFQQGARVEGCYLLERGEIALRRLARAGGEIEVARIGEGDWFGEIVLFADRSEAASKVHRISPPQARRGCPGSAVRSFTPLAANRAGPTAGAPSELGQWPIQLQLVSPAAPYFRKCDLLVAADCTAFALGAFHAELLRGKALVIACPTLDRTEAISTRSPELIADNTVYSTTVAIMEVPCCSSLSRIVAEALAKSGKDIAIRTIVVGIDGHRAAATALGTSSGRPRAL